MDKFPILWEGRPVGELTAEREPSYTRFTASCRLPGEGVWCVWLVGSGGTLRLGVPTPSGMRAALDRRFSPRMTASLGTLLRGELRPAGAAAEKEPPWREEPAAEKRFRTPWLSRQLAGRREILLREAGGRTLLAFPQNHSAPFPLPGLFCFAREMRVRERPYWVFAFDEQERPIF